LDRVIAFTQVYIQIVVVVIGANRSGHTLGRMLGIDYHDVVAFTADDDGLVEVRTIVHFANCLAAAVDMQEVVAFSQVDIVYAVAVDMDFVITFTGYDALVTIAFDFDSVIAFASIDGLVAVASDIQLVIASAEVDFVITGIAVFATDDNGVVAFASVDGAYAIAK